MGTGKIPGCPFHGFHIIIFMKRTEIFSFKYIFMTACPDPVAVQFFPGVQTAVKPVGNLADPEDLNVLREIMVHIFAYFFTVKICLEMAVGHLAQSVDSRVCPSCSLYLYRLSCHTGKDLLDLSLDRILCSFLSLPASVSGSIILYVKSIVHIFIPLLL